MNERSLANALASRLDHCANPLVFKSALFRAIGRLRLPAHARWRCNAVDQLLQPPQRIGAVRVLAARSLRLDHDDSCIGNSLVAQSEQPLLDVGWQRRRGHVEAQVHRARNLVDVLPAGALRANRGEVDFIRVNLRHCRSHRFIYKRMPSIGLPPVQKAAPWLPTFGAKGEHRILPVNGVFGRAGTLLNFVGCVVRPDEEESWMTVRPWSELNGDYRGWHPMVRAVIDAVDRDQCFRSPLNNRTPVARWSAELATLLGDAVHATLPYMAQGAHRSRGRGVERDGRAVSHRRSRPDAARLSGPQHRQVAQRVAVPLRGAERRADLMTPQALLAHYDEAELWPSRREDAASLDVAAAYRDALAVRALRIGRGERPVGYKIGFTNRTIWERYGVFAPIWGPVWNTTLTVCDGRGAVDLSGTCQPRLEPEIVFGIAETPPADASLEDLFACIDWLAPGFEVVQSHCVNWKFTAAETVADGALHARLLIGRRTSVREFAASGKALDVVLAKARVRLLRGEALIDEGTGINVLDGPLHALHHFVHEMQRCPARRACAQVTS